MFKDESGQIVPAIVSEELWDRANEVLKRRSDDVKSRQGICNHKNLLTGKLYCTCCGTAYYRRDSKDKLGNKNSKWVCSGKIKNGSDSCDSFAIYEDEIKPVLFVAFRETEVNVAALIEEYMEMYRSLDENNQIPALIEAQKQRKDLAQKKKNKLLGFNAAGELSDADFLAMNKQCTKEIEDAEEQIHELEQQLFSREEFRKHMDTIKAALEAAQRDASSGLITSEFVSKYIDKIFVTPEADGYLRLDIKIFTGETTQKYLAKLKSRTGQMSKKMIEAYEQGLQ